jgi:hypothetical protein
MKVAICTPLRGRVAVARCWWAGVARLRATWAAHDVWAYVAGDEDEHRELAAQQERVVWVEHENLPLGKKWNALVERAWMDGVDAAIILGSDDLLDAGLAQAYGEAFDDGLPTVYGGVRGCVMIEPTSSRALWIGGHAQPGRLGEMLGAGRILGKVALDALKGRPWPDNINHGMDFRMTIRLRKAGFLRPDLIFERDQGTLLDVKTGTNIWSYDHIARHKSVVTTLDYADFVQRFPECELIRALEG